MNHRLELSVPSSPRQTPRRLGSALTGIGLILLCGSAAAQDQDDIDAELRALEAGQAGQETPEAEQAAPAPAEAAAPVVAPSAVTPPPNDEIDEVVVTADRRRKSLQDYSGTAQAFSQQKLQQVGVTGVTGLAQMVPGLQIGQQEGNTEVFIRGVGNDNNTEIGDMGVAIHLDGVYIPRPRGVGAMFFDIERVEVASGPQGTLRGRNAQGGSLDIVTAKPKLNEYGAYAQATFGTFAERRYEGMINIPLSDTLAVRGAALSSQHDPHWENAGPLNSLRAPQDENLYAFRLQAKWQPTQSFSVLVGGDYLNEGGTGYSGANHNNALTFENDNGTPAVPGDDFVDPVLPEDIDNPRRTYRTGHQARVKTKHKGARLNMSYDAGPAIFDLTGSYRDLVYTQYTGSSPGVIFPGFDFDEPDPDGFGSAYWLSRSQSQMVELRAYAPDTARLRWTAGVFGLLEQQQVVLQQNNDPANGYGGAEFNMPDVDGDSYAAYADATFDIQDNLRVFGGVRLTTETKSRFNGLGMQLRDFGSRGRYGTEGFRPRYFGRTLYTEADAMAALTDADLAPEFRDLPDDDPTKIAARGSAARVNLFLDGVGSFGARDEIAVNLCEPVFQAEDGAEQQDLITVGPNGALRCTNGVSADVGSFNIDSIPQNAETSNEFLDYRVGVEYDLNPDSMLYGKVSTAHKAAGYNDNIDTNINFDLYYDPERVISYELGSKNRLFGRQTQLNAALFFYQYDDQVFQQVVQISPADENGNANTVAIRQNAASSNIYGLDLDFIQRLPFGFEAELHALVMDARFGADTIVTDGRIDFSGNNYEVDIDGKWLPRASKYTLNYSLSQDIYTAVGQFDWIVQAQTRSKHFMTAFNGQGNLLPEVNGNIPTSGEYLALTENAARLTDVIPMYTRIDLGARWRHPDGRLAIQGYVNNATNITYATSVISTPNLNLRFFNPPRTAGVRVRVDW